MRFLKLSILSGFIFLTLSASAQEGFTARIYALGNTQGSPLFVQKTRIERSEPESFISNSSIEDRNSQIVMTEKVVVKNGGLVFQEVEQRQSQQAWELRVEDRRAIYRSFKLSEGKRSAAGKESSQPVKDDFINGPMTEIFIRKNWDSLGAGKTVEAQFSVLELERSVNFKFHKEKSSVRGGQKVRVIKMTPANFFISMLVDAIYMEFDESTRRLVYFRGRTPLKIKEKGHEVPLDAEIFYSDLSVPKT